MDLFYKLNETCLIIAVSAEVFPCHNYNDHTNVHHQFLFSFVIVVGISTVAIQPF